jgi:hypothetical protein
MIRLHSKYEDIVLRYAVYYDTSNKASRTTSSKSKSKSLANCRGELMYALTAFNMAVVLMNKWANLTRHTFTSIYYKTMMCYTPI